DVLRPPLSLPDQLPMQRVADASQHLEVEGRRAIPREVQGPVDHAAVVTRDREVPASAEQQVEVRQVRPVDRLSRGIRNLGRFGVGPLDETDPGPGSDQPLDVPGGPFQVRLEADPHLVVRLQEALDRKSTRLNSSHEWISYAV